jgi:hypothetical protein
MLNLRVIELNFKRKKKVKEIAEWIDDMKKWDYIMSLRFNSDEIVEDAARRMLKWQLKYINADKVEIVYGPLEVFFLLEFNANRRGVHVHLFLKGIYPSSENREYLEKKVLGLLTEKKEETKKTSFFRSADIRCFVKDGGFNYYCAKKILGNNLVSWGFAGINTRWKENRIRKEVA